MLHMKTRVSIKYFVNDCLWKLFFDSNYPQIPANVIPLTILVPLRPFTLFYPKVGAIKFQESAKICLTWKMFFRPFD